VIVDKSASGKRVAVLFMTSRAATPAVLSFSTGTRTIGYLQYPSERTLVATLATELHNQWMCPRFSLHRRRVNRSSIHLTSTGHTAKVSEDLDVFRPIDAVVEAPIAKNVVVFADGFALTMDELTSPTMR